MKMDAREYTLVNYFYSILKVVVGFLPFTILFGMDRGVPLWFCVLLPLCIAGMELFAAAVTLWDYEKRGFSYNENMLSKYVWCCIALLLAAAYAPPAFGFALPAVVPMVIFLACIPLGLSLIHISRQRTVFRNSRKSGRRSRFKNRRRRQLHEKASVRVSTVSYTHLDRCGTRWRCSGR